jgi:hypothetical protein
MERVYVESFWPIYQCLADELVGCEAFEGLEITTRLRRLVDAWPRIYPVMEGICSSFISNRNKKSKNKHMDTSKNLWRVA